MAIVVLVAGMHRSGTSAFTRALNLAGLPLPSHLMAPSPFNADSAWESQELADLEDAILRSLGSGWSDPREIPEAWAGSPSAERVREALAAWLTRETDGKEMLLVKDPRVCRLIPLWRIACDMAGVTLRVAIPVRNPIEVANSLKARDNFPEAHSYVLWLRHVLDAERHTRDLPRTFTSFDELMQRPLETVRRVTTDLRLALSISDAELERRLNSALKPSLRHYVSSDAALAKVAEEIPALRTVYEWILNARTVGSQATEPLDSIAAAMRLSEHSRGAAIAAL